MQSLGVRLPILAVTAWAGIGLSVSAMGYRYGETVEVMPTVATVAWPTSYVETASYVPTGYSFSRYMPTAYAYEPATMATSTYVTTGYAVRRGLFGRPRLVARPVIASYATSYLPTTYFSSPVYATSYRATSYVPTVFAPRIYRPTVYATVYEDSPSVWESSYVGSAGGDCDQVAWNMPARVVPSQTYSASAPSYSDSGSVSRSQPVVSEPPMAPSIPSRVVDSAADEPPISSAVPDNPKPPAATEYGGSPPVVPAAPRQQSTAQPSSAAPASASPGTPAGAPATEAPKAGSNAPATPKVAPPAAPGGDPTEPDLKPAPIDNPLTNRRESLRPSNYTIRASTGLRSARTVLNGRVESDAGEPLDEVPVSATNRDNTAIRRAGMTDAYGNFHLGLDDGVWTVSVRKPSGRVYAVRSVTVTNGKVMDNQEGREVRNLIISY